MAFDDEDTPTSTRPPKDGVGEGEDGATAEEDALEEEAQDFRDLSSLITTKRGVSSRAIRRGEKDFEAHGTRAQDQALEQSRQVMTEVLSYTRVHKPSQWLRGWYFPDHLANFGNGEEDRGGDGGGGTADRDAERRRRVFARDRVVAVESDSGHFKSTGRVILGLAKSDPGRGKIWLLPEEALFLMERGTLDLWWPMKGLETVFTTKKGGKNDGEESTTGADVERDVPCDEYELGLPLSLEAAYSLLLGKGGERGKTTLQQFQVYSSLRRAGFHVMRAESPAHATPQPQSQPPSSIWQWLFSLLLLDKEPHHPPYGPLVKPGLYRSYQTIYKQLALLPRHKPNSNPNPKSERQVQKPFTIHFDVWKAGTGFPKTRAPPPDFYVAVVDAQESAVPTLEEISTLLDATPHCPPKPQWQGPRTLYPRLKHGHRNVVVAVVDHGIVNYLRFAEGAFGEEPLWPRFDSPGGGRGGGGKRGGGRGGFRGGRGGRRGR